MEEKPIDMILFCPACGKQHIDEPDDEPCKDGCQMAKDYGFSPSEGHYCSSPCGYMQEGSSRWTNPPHRSHLCLGCGHIWRPADVPTNGVKEIKTKGKTDSPLRHELEAGMNLLGEVAPAFIGAVSAYETYGKRHSLVGRAETDAMFTTRLADMKKVARQIHLFFKSE